MIQPIGNSLITAGLGLTTPVPDPAGTQRQPAPEATPAKSAGTPPDQSQQTSLGNSDMRQYPESPKSSLEKALDAVNDNLKAWSTGIRFDMDKDVGRLVVSITDTATGKVLRTIPSEAVLKVAKVIAALQGSGVDTQA